MKRLNAVFLSVSVMLMVGCALFDFDGNGRFDPVAYLEGADISVCWVDQESGEVYTMAIDELGVKILGEFVHAKTGYRFQLSGDGGISIVDPDGKILQIKQKAKVE